MPRVLHPEAYFYAAQMSEYGITSASGSLFLGFLLIRLQ
jgi:hypothetical protein